MKLSIIIPLYNESSTINQLIGKVLSVPMDGYEKQIIVVDDGSTDGSLALIKNIYDKNKNILILSLSPNKGKGAAIREGLNCADGEIVILQDADLELDPNEYGGLIEPIIKGQTDVVYGSRFMKDQPNIGLYKKITNCLLTKITNILYGSSLTDQATAYKVFRREIIKNIKIESDRFEICSEITAKLLKKGILIKEIPIGYHPRSKNEGKKIRFWDGIMAVSALIKWKILN